METKKIVSIIAAFALFFTLGLIVGSSFNLSRNESERGSVLGSENTFQAGWEAAKKRLAESGFLPPIIDQEIKSLGGEVKRVVGNQILLKIRPLEPLADPELDERIVEVGSDAKVYKLEQKDQAALQKEQEEFNKNVLKQLKGQVEQPAVASTTLLTPPQLYIKKEVSVSEIKEGQRISITSDKDIKSSKKIKAVEVLIEDMPAMPGIPVTPPVSSGAGQQLPVPPTAVAPINPTDNPAPQVPAQSNK